MTDIGSYNIRRQLWDGTIALYCWQCGGDLTVRKGKLVYIEIEIDGGQEVIHVSCLSNVKNGLPRYCNEPVGGGDG